MPRLLLPFTTLLAFSTHLASAGISFTKPKPGDKLDAGTAIEVNWEEGGTGPKITDLLTYELFLVAGTDDVQFVVTPVTTQGSFAVSNVASGMVGTAAGESSPDNAYFLKMVAVAKAGGQLITYSGRFSYKGMTGTFPANVKTALAAGKLGTSGPDTQDNTIDPAKPVAAGGDYGVAYTMQTGATRYAPMQPVPPKKITAKDTKPLYPTSSVAIATTPLKPPKIQTTLTQSQTYSVQSRENTVAPAPHATDDMAKYLNRWKD